VKQFYILNFYLRRRLFKKYITIAEISSATTLAMIPMSIVCEAESGASVESPVTGIAAAEIINKL